MRCNSELIFNKQPYVNPSKRFMQNSSKLIKCKKTNTNWNRPFLEPFWHNDWWFICLSLNSELILHISYTHSLLWLLRSVHQSRRDKYTERKNLTWILAALELVESQMKKLNIFTEFYRLKVTESKRGVIHVQKFCIWYIWCICATNLKSNHTPD